MSCFENLSPGNSLCLFHQSLTSLTPFGGIPLSWNDKSVIVKGVQTGCCLWIYEKCSNIMFRLLYSFGFD